MLRPMLSRSPEDGHWAEVSLRNELFEMLFCLRV